jgi:benzoyl-CoA 2,3-epoxidase subunit B
VATYGGVPLDMLQRYLNFHYSISLDLFGGETSTNVATYFTAGLKGRWAEDTRHDDHLLVDGLTEVDAVVDGRCSSVEVSAVLGLNQDLRNRYIADCESGVARWNRSLAEHGVDMRLRLPHRGFNRRVGAFAGHSVTVDGEMVTAQEWQRQVSGWLPTDADRAHVAALMQPVLEPGRMAGWLAAPKSGVNGQPLDYEYVRPA